MTKIRKKRLPKMIKTGFPNKKKMINIFFNFGDNKSRNSSRRKKSSRYTDLMRCKRRDLS